MEKIVYEGSLLNMRLIEIYLREHGIRCRTVEVIPGYRVYSTSKIIVDESNYAAADKLVREYLKANQKPFRRDLFTTLQLILIGLLVLFFVLQGIFRF
jgi:hypothetical protein